MEVPDTSDDIPANSLLYPAAVLNDQMKFFELMAVMFLVDQLLTADNIRSSLHH